MAALRLKHHAVVFHFTTAKGDSMATTSEHDLAELKRELAEIAKQAERLAGWAREISDRLERSAAAEP